MKTAIKKNIILLCLVYFCTVFSVGHCDCPCNHSPIIEKVLEVERSIVKTVKSIPHGTKKILASGVIKTKGVLEDAKDLIYDGVDYVKGVFGAIIDWANETKNS